MIVLLCLFVFYIFRRFLINSPQFFYYVIHDILHRDKNYFRLFGLRLYCGRQGAGKTIGLVYDLERFRKKYPRCKIIRILVINIKLLRLSP